MTRRKCGNDIKRGDPSVAEKILPQEDSGGEIPSVAFRYAPKGDWGGEQGFFAFCLVLTKS